MQPLDVHIHTNTGCNLQCRHCYVGTQRQINAVIADDFEIELISFLCRSFDADIHLEGGEIFLEEHLIQALNRLNDRHKKVYHDHFKRHCEDVVAQHIGELMLHFTASHICRRTYGRAAQES